MIDNIYLLFIIELIFICISYYISQGNLLSPSFVTYMMFALSTICVIYNIDFWSVDFSTYALFVVFCGFLTMILAEVFVKQIFASKNRNLNIVSINQINVNKFLLFILCINAVLLTLIYVFEVFRNGSSIGAAGLYVIGTVKYDETAGVGMLGKIAIRYTQIFFYFSVYILFHNIIKGKQLIINNKVYMIGITCYLIVLFIGGNRLGFVKVLVAFYVCYLAMSYQMKSVHSFDPKPFIKKILIGGFLLLIVFYNTRAITKLSTDTVNRSFVEYITYYVGSPVYLFSKYLEDPLKVHGKNTVFGEQTFSGIYDSMGISLDFNNSFIYVGGDSRFAGNACSWFQRPYNDFGLWGMLVFTFIVYFFFSYILYKKILRKKEKKVNVALVIYMFFFFIIVMSFYYCQTCWAITPLNIITVYIIVLMIKKIPFIKIKL